ncbi:phosphoribosyltransferase domain-containing protein [Nakamurella sp. A5-74]|uniref:Phosphoribosyltransferase domain-containing protein n=1 Tax=Nakamurella sp. A5-74 TaxID=3158264 RepID=A0AAU8DMY6_9ACTN
MTLHTNSVPTPGLPQIELVTRSSPVDLDVSDLISLALRHNPRRAHLWVSKVLGKHVGVHPDIALGCGRLLGGLVDALLHDRPVPDRWAAAAVVALSDIDPSALVREIPCAAVPSDAPTVTSWRGADGPVVIGFAETATALGSTVAEALGSRFSLHSTRRPSELVPTAGTFEEGHSHATTHLLTPWPSHRLAGGDPLVLVDDELSTGHTARATIGQLHAQFPGRSHYVVATLVDLRSDADRDALQQWADEQGLRVDVVSLVAATAAIPADLAVRAAAHIAALHAITPEVPPIETVEATDLAPTAPIADLTLDWPEGLRQGGRFGTAGGSLPARHRAAAQAAARLRAALPAAARRILVIGTEEFLYLPLLIAGQLAKDHDVRFQSTTRSPVHAEHTAGYPIRRRLRFGDRPGGSADDGEAARFLYNADWPVADGWTEEADAIVLICDDAPADAVRAVATLQIPYLVARLPADRPWPPALTGPTFGSYRGDEVSWLLTDLSAADLEGAVGEREQRVQSGAEHYAESLPVEYQPGPEYTELFHRMLQTSADRLALAVAALTELVIAERGEELTLVSLARAGTPVGVLMRRWAARRGLTLPHYSVSIVRDRGIDPVALEHLARHHDPSTVVFVDGWTGKGAITVELAQALESFRAETGARFDPTIAVLADPGSCTPLHGTRDDFLIASACLNSTVSGLVSRTVLNPDLTSPQQFHGAKFYADLAEVDLSNTFVDTVSAHFDDIAARVPSALAELQASDRTPSFAGMAAVEQVRQRYGLPSVNLVKPGVGETTRVLLRRVPWKVLVREPDSPDHLHIRLLAADRAVPVEHVPDLPYACMGLIRPIGST